MILEFKKNQRGGGHTQNLLNGVEVKGSFPILTHVVRRIVWKTGVCKPKS